MKGLSTIYIRSDGSIDPPTAPISRDGDTYDLTGNINGTIVIERNNTMLNGANYVVQGEGGGWPGSIGIHLVWSTANNTITNMTIMLHSDAINADHSINNTIVKNYFLENEVAINLRIGSNNITVRDNIFIDNNSGVLLYGSNHTTVYGNSITSTEYGISLYTSYDCRVYKNTVTGCSRAGLFLSNSQNNSLYLNNVTSSMLGAELEGRAFNNKFYHNNFLNNDKSADAHDVLSNIWDNGYPSGGNYWDSHDRRDDKSGLFQNETGKDGIADNSLNISGYLQYGENIDHYPLVSPHPNPPWEPVSLFSFSPQFPVVDEIITFNGSESFDLDGNVTSYYWEFDDGSNTTTLDSISTHAFSMVGIHNVTLTVTDDDGFIDARTESVNIGRMPTFISISTSSTTTYIGFSVRVTGTLSDLYDRRLKDEMVVLYYTFSGVGTWTPISSDVTNELGEYEISWIPTATGYFELKAEWIGNVTFSSVENIVTLSSLPYHDDYVFTVESNSSISELAFNSTDWSLGFTVEGPEGSVGYVRLTVAKNLVGNPSNIRININELQTQYSISELDDSWLLSFNYLHSTHHVQVDLDVTVISEFPPGVFLVLLLFVPLTILLRRKRML